MNINIGIEEWKAEGKIAMEQKAHNLVCYERVEYMSFRPINCCWKVVATYIDC